MLTCPRTPESFEQRFERRALEVTGVRLAPGWLQRASACFPSVMRECSVASREELEALLLGDRAGATRLVERLVGEVTVKETRLFRDAPQMRLLRRVVLPEAREVGERRGTPVRLWSAGCATGEEAYSLAMLAAEEFSHSGAGAFTVVGTDISASAVAHARRGVYRHRSAALGVEEEFEPLVDRYTRTDADGATIIEPELRSQVRFAVHNLIAGPRMSGQDVVLCRNVLVYLPREAQATLVSRLWDSLHPGGWLLTGEADLLHLVCNDFERWSHPSATLYRKPLDAGTGREGGGLRG